MKFKLLFFFIFLVSCTTNYTKTQNKIPYNSKGFAYIYNENDFMNKSIKGKFDNSKLQVAHNKLKQNTLIRILNPKTNDDIVLKNTRKIDFPDFYKILITEKVAEKINLNKEIPLIEIIEIKKNKSFVAKKAKIFSEEKKLSTNAPVTSVQISNISKDKNQKKITKEGPKNIYILIASFSNRKIVEFLVERISIEIPNYDTKKLKIRKKSNKQIDLISGPYSTVNLVKNDYNLLKKFGFEELNIIANE